MILPSPPFVTPTDEGSTSCDRFPFGSVEKALALFSFHAPSMAQTHLREQRFPFDL